MQNVRQGIQEMTENHKASYPFYFDLLLYCFTFFVVGMGSILYKIQINRILQLMGCSFIAITMIVIALKQNIYIEHSINGNKMNAKRFIIIFCFCLLIAVILPLIPYMVWPYMAIYICLGLFSSGFIGIISGTICLLLSCTFLNSNIMVFCSFMICGLFGIAIFRNITEEFKVGIPIFISECSLTVCLLILLLEYSFTDVSCIVYLFVNLIISFLLLLIILKLYSSYVVHILRDKYIELNDPESELMSSLKQCSVDEYLRAIHISHFCDLIAKELDLYEPAIKVAAYYHNIGMILGKNDWENTEKICEDYHFPLEVRNILREYIDSETAIKKTETVVLCLSDCVITSILYLFSKNKDMQIDIDKLIQTIFKQQFESHKYLKSEITLEQIEKMKHIFIKEKLYYDFLRRE